MLCLLLVVTCLLVVVLLVVSLFARCLVRVTCWLLLGVRYSWLVVGCSYLFCSLFFVL